MSETPSDRLEPMRANPAKRTDSTVQRTEVRLVCQPWGRNRENPPSLRNLRDFVEACEGLPDDLNVRIEKGYQDERGRHTITFSVERKVSI